MLRTVYAHEVLGFAGKDRQWKDLLLNVVTGGGKTAIIAALIAWLRLGAIGVGPDICQSVKISFVTPDLPANG